MIVRPYHLSRLVLAAGTLAVWGCSGATDTSMLDATQVNQTIGARVGQQVNITLGTVGPGQYDSIPAVSSTAVRFIDASFVGPAIPSGPQQLFRFTGQTTGVAIITFRHTGMNPTVVDTIAVR
jgi:hypothetical protein